MYDTFRRAMLSYVCPVRRGAEGRSGAARLHAARHACGAEVELVLAVAADLCGQNELGRQASVSLSVQAAVAVGLGSAAAAGWAAADSAAVGWAAAGWAAQGWAAAGSAAAGSAEAVHYCH